MKGYSLALAAALLLALVGDHVIFAQNPPCDPDRDRRNPNLQAAKEAKKAQLRRAGYPERFMKLIDREECIACVREASDAFHIMIVYKDNAYAPTDPKTGNKWTHVSTNWDPESELIAREKTKDGTIKGYYILNTLKRACKCCPDIDDNKLPEDYSDWDEDLQANKNQLIPFDQSNTTGPPPDDLINPSPQWIDDPVPNIETFQKPGRKQVTAPCPQCAGEALKLNDAYRALDELWDQKISLMNEQSVLENTEATRRNEISLLEYRQRSALTRTPDGGKKIEELEKAQDADNATMRRNAIELEVLDRSIEILMPKMGQLEKALEACAERCKTAAITDAPPPPIATNTNVPPLPAPRPPSGSLPPLDTVTCPACQQAAEDVRVAQREVNAADARLTALLERQDALIDFQGSAPIDLNAMQSMALELDYDIRKQRLLANERRNALIAAVMALRTCNESCQTGNNRSTQPTVTPTPPTTPVEQPALPRAEVFNGPPPQSGPEYDGGYPLVPAKCPICDQEASILLRIRRELFDAAQSGQEAKARQFASEYELQRQKLDYCNKELCRSISDFPEPKKPTCPKCAKAYADALYYYQELKNYLPLAPSAGAAGSLLYKYNFMMKELEACQRVPCVTETETPTAVPQPVLPPVEVFNPPPQPIDRELINIFNPDAPTECFGDSCGNDWNICESNDSCPPVEEDCGIPGTCERTNPVGGGLAPLVNYTDGFTWTPPNIQIEIRIQIKVADLIDPGLYPQYLQQVSGLGSLVIPPAIRQGVQRWFDPLGLLARRMVDQIERWRGSVGPRPLIKTRDLELIDRVSNVQAAGLPKGVHVLLTDQGGSTGRTLVMNVLNLTGQPVRLSSKPFAVQPIQPQAHQQVMQAFSRLSQAAPVRLDLAAYCVEFLKAPPGPSTLLRLAPPDIQQKYSSMSKVLQSAYRVAKGNALHPDSNPAAYTDAMKQWSIWVVEQNLNEARFTDAFLSHTKKNVEAAKQQWSKQAEDMIRAASPNRWRDIIKILQGAGVPVPR